jgi:hypothetical protein
MLILRKRLSIVMKSRYRISWTLATPFSEAPVRKVFRKSRSANTSKRGYLGKEGRRRLIFVTHIRIDPISTEVRFRRLHDSTLMPPVVWLWVSVEVICM